MIGGETPAHGGPNSVLAGGPSSILGHGPNSIMGPNSLMGPGSVMAPQSNLHVQSHQMHSKLLYLLLKAEKNGFPKSKIQNLTFEFFLT